MNITQKDIQELVLYSKKILTGRSDLYPEDIVQDILVESIENGNCSIDFIKNEIKKRSYKEKCSVTKGSPNSFGAHETRRYCKCCNDDIPIGLFYIFSYNDVTKRKILSAYCKDCSREKMKKRWRQLHPTPRANKIYATKEIAAEAKRQKARDLYNQRKLTPGFLESQAAKKMQSNLKRKEYIREYNRSQYQKRKLSKAATHIMLKSKAA